MKLRLSNIEADTSEDTPLKHMAFYGVEDRGLLLLGEEEL